MGVRSVSLYIWIKHTIGIVNLLKSTIMDRRDLIDSFITHMLSFQHDFPSLEAIAIIERIKFHHGCSPFRHLLCIPTGEGLLANSQTNPRLNFWSIFSKSWDVWKEGELESDTLKVACTS